MAATSQPDLCLPTKQIQTTQCKFNRNIYKFCSEKCWGACRRKSKSGLGASIPVSTDQMVINNEVTASATLQFKLLLGSGLVSWACLRWRFGFTTKDLHFQITAGSAERTYQPWRVCALQDRSYKLQQQPGRPGLDYQKPEAKIWNLNPYMVPQYVFLTFLPCISSPRWNYSFSSLCCPKEELLHSGIPHPSSRFSLKRRSLNLLFWTVMFSHTHQ